MTLPELAKIEQDVMPIFNYDEPSDTLYISFSPGEAATGIELNEHILLRINQAECRAGCAFSLLQFQSPAQTLGASMRARSNRRQSAHLVCLRTMRSLRAAIDAGSESVCADARVNNGAYEAPALPEPPCNCKPTPQLSSHLLIKQK